MLSETALFPVNDFQKYLLATGYKVAQPTLKITVELLDFTNDVIERNTYKLTFLPFKRLSNQAHTADL